VILTNGRAAGKKGVVLSTYDAGTKVLLPQRKNYPILALFFGFFWGRTENSDMLWWLGS
jgi:hypothetical protein